MQFRRIPMASIDKRPNGKYRLRWREVPRGPQTTEHFDRKADADNRRVEVEHKIRSGQYVDPKLGRESLRDHAERWRSMQIHRPTTAATVDVTFRVHVYPTFGDRPIVSIRPSEIQAWVANLSKKLA